MTSSSAAVSLGSRLAGPRLITAEITLVNGYYTPHEGSLRRGVTTDTPRRLPTQAGWMVQPITDRLMEQIMERSISVTSYRWARCLCLQQRWSHGEGEKCLEQPGTRH